MTLHRLLLGLVVLASWAVGAPGATGQPVRADTIAVADSSQNRPRGAVLRSLALPGWGQVYNGEVYKAPFAAGLVVGAGVFGAVQQNRYLLYRRAAFYANCVDVPDRAVCEGYESRQDEWEATGELSADQNERIRDAARGNRDVGIVIVVGAYALQLLDAYVAAQLSDFDVSEDLSLRLEPQPGGGALTLRLDL